MRAYLARGRPLSPRLNRWARERDWATAAIGWGALLLECAEEAGIDREDAQRVLMSGAYEAEVHAAFLSVQKMGIKSPVKRLEPWSFDAHSCSCPPDPKALPPKALPLRPFLSRGQSSIPVRQARSPSSSSKSKG